MQNTPERVKFAQERHSHQDEKDAGLWAKQIAQLEADAKEQAAIEARKKSKLAEPNRVS